jgi:uncharacterized protein
MDSGPLFAAIRAGDLAAVDRIVTAVPEMAMASDETGRSAVTVAAFHGRWPVVERLLATAPDLDQFEASIVGDTVRLRAQLDEADRERAVERDTTSGDGDSSEPVDELSPDGFSALHLAAFFGRPEAVRLLLDRGADPNRWATGTLRVQPLHSAVAGGDQAVAAMLIESGADVGSRQDFGFTPLMGAAANGMTGTVDLLLDRGADPRARNDDILTAAELAERAGHAAIAARIRAGGG